jgi:hypothetical protein
MTNRSDRHSAEVSLVLRVNGIALALSHVEPDEIRVVESHAPILGSCSGELVITVNGREERKSVFLPTGVPAAGERARYF